jgi:excisionase family DNA binding protein
MKSAFEVSGSSPTQFEPLLDDEQAAEMLCLHPKTLQKLARQGKIPAIRMGRFWRFRASMLNTWIETMVGSQRQAACVGTAKGAQ